MRCWVIKTDVTGQSAASMFRIVPAVLSELNLPVRSHSVG
jgi:hypothetical protein